MFVAVLERMATGSVAKQLKLLCHNNTYIIINNNKLIINQYHKKTYHVVDAMSTHHEDAHADRRADDPKEIGRHAYRICVGVTVPDGNVHDETDDCDVTEEHSSSTGVHDIISTLYQLGDLVMFQTIETEFRSFNLTVFGIVLYLLFQQLVFVDEIFGKNN